MTKEIKPAARGVIDDVAEQWLRENDSGYAKTKRGWAAPTHDALSRARSEANEIHSTLEDLAEISPRGYGHYRRQASIDELEAPVDDEEPT